MLDTTMIQTRGFRNRDDGGFELRVRLPYYRGQWASLLEGASVTVDGVAYPAESVRWRLGGEEYTLGELTSSTSLRWAVDEPATLIVPASEPLGVGFHDVAVDLRLRMSYIPEELQPTISTEERRMAITR
ncbi:hypothetical protein J2W21_002066 [Sinomonas atrocyanea]|uniref:C-glycoside deglycosidase beta subunit domain-containing protein n=1 Tax=Sinomonas atrocyanea TaxID=37927 RepID=UPI002788A1C9|nr:DUF6379 domain-containing protein [Sinomonas atrocyanea]MDP9884553.1 hypothetical protein [Sinomonas atrocyanea]